MQASEGHHHLSAGNVISFEHLSLLFAATDDTGLVDGSEMVGARYRDVLQEIAAITEYQWRSGTSRGLVKGFMLSGPPGTGKTTLAKRLAYELGRRFAAEDEPPVTLAFVDRGEIFRSRYGDSEGSILDSFVHARSG